ncbi:MAG TPA: extracellular solute-binding protein [Acetobacteraceae bacterium]|nr:extracellular solute-binding protein [Acetobacteraceae bacterium]
MNTITRRRSFEIGAGLLAATALPAGGARADVPVADVKPPSFPIEKGAQLHVLRPTKYIDPDETIFIANSKRFTEQTGVPVKVDFVNWPDMPTQTAIAANTGAGPDIIIAFGPDPHLFLGKIVELTDLADYLGARYGGWYPLAELYGRKWESKDWIGLPMGGTTGPCVYRISWVKQAGFDKIPNDLNQFLTLCQNLKKIGHPCGFALSHAVGDAPGFANWLLWSHGAYLVDEQGKVALDSKETRQAVDYAREIYPTMISGTMSWDGASNNKGFAAGQLGLTQNGVSIYYVLKMSKDPAMNAMAEDTGHAVMPMGVAHAPPESALTLNAMLFRYSKYPNAAKEYLRFMMEAPQYDAWLTGCLGYWSQPLKAYSQSKVWTSDPKLDVYRDAMSAPFYDGYKGPITAAAGAVLENWILVDMFAKAVTGAATPEAAIKEAVRGAKRYYKS